MPEDARVVAVVRAETRSGPIHIVAVECGAPRCTSCGSYCCHAIGIARAGVGCGQAGGRVGDWLVELCIPAAEAATLLAGNGLVAVVSEELRPGQAPPTDKRSHAGHILLRGGAVYCESCARQDCPHCVACGCPGTGATRDTVMRASNGRAVRWSVVQLAFTPEAQAAMMAARMEFADRFVSLKAAP